jgi:polyisoprenoid-binding protein YceI
MSVRRFFLIIVGIIGIGIASWMVIGKVQSTQVDNGIIAKIEEDRAVLIPVLAGGNHPAGSRFAPVRYKLDASKSRFIIDAKATGLLWFLGHPHHIAAKEFEGEVELTSETLQPATLQMRIKTASLAETGEHFTDQQRQIITSTMHKEVLETEKYPEAVLKSVAVTAKKVGENQFEAKIEGDLTLHGVTRHLVIPAKVMVNGNTMEASGRFEFDRDDYNIKTHSIKGGTIRVDDDMRVSFTIVANRY